MEWGFEFDAHPSKYLLGGRPVAAVTSRNRLSANRRKTHRWVVHLGMIITVTASLVLEPVLVLHVSIGLLFVLLAGCHLAQRRNISKRLATHFLSVRRILLPGGRRAVTDALLTLVTAGMMVSGFWDVWAPHHTKIRWHAIAGIALAAFLVVHVANRWRRLRVSQIS